MVQVQKQLILVRHAKSSWKDMEIKDHDRPLNKRGIRNVPLMGEFLKGKIGRPDLMITSSAKRAKETAIGFASDFDIPENDYIETSELYHASSRDIINLVSRQTTSNNVIMLFGHNPGITSLVNELTGAEIENVPTCGVAIVTLDINNWNELKTAKGKLSQYYYPKGIK